MKFKKDDFVTARLPYDRDVKGMQVGVVVFAACGGPPPSPLADEVRVLWAPLGKILYHSDDRCETVHPPRGIRLSGLAFLDK